MKKKMIKAVGVLALFCAASLFGTFVLGPLIEDHTGLGTNFRISFAGEPTSPETVPDEGMSGETASGDKGEEVVEVTGNDNVEAGGSQDVENQTAELTATPEPTPTATPTPSPLPTATPIPEPTEDYLDTVITIIGGIQADKADFLFPESSSTVLSQARMDEVLNSSDKNTRHKLSQLAINELLARYGYPFTKDSSTAEDARQQFNNKAWYQSAREVCPSRDYRVIYNNYFNYYERTNFDLLNQWQIDHGVYY